MLNIIVAILLAIILIYTQSKKVENFYIPYVASIPNVLEYPPYSPYAPTNCMDTILAGTQCFPWMSWYSWWPNWY